MRNREAFILLSLLIWLILTNAQSTQAQQLPAIGPQPAVSSRVIVVGAVRSPAQFELRRNVRLTELISCVGGLSPDAKGKINIFRTRPGEIDMTVIMVDLKAIKKHPDADPVIQPYDIVEVPRKGKGTTDCCLDCSQRMANALSKLPWRLIK